jgi:hypothetical protein
MAPSTTSRIASTGMDSGPNTSNSPPTVLASARHAMMAFTTSWIETGCKSPVPSPITGITGRR